MQVDYNKAILEPIREIFANSQNSYYVYGCELVDEIEGNVKLNKFNNVTLCGIMPQLELYKRYTVVMKEETNKKYQSVQYAFVTIENNIPKTQEEQIDYFNTLLTPTQVQNIFKIYDDPLKEFMEDTFDYTKVKGFGPVTYERVKRKILENYVLFDLLTQLSQYGITYRQILKLYDRYKNIKLILDKINNNPYVLMELEGIGFKKSDKIAEKMGIAKNDIRRINACIFYVLENEENNGHTWLHIGILETEVKKLTGNFDDNFLEIIKSNKNLVYIDNEKVTTLKAYNTELKIAEHLNRLENSQNLFKKYNIQFDLEDFILKQEKEQGFKYNNEQKKAFENLINHNVSVILGYAGSGKSTTVNGILNFLDKIFVNYILFSPTAKACKVLRNYTGRDAYTYERGLGWTPFGFTYNENLPLPVSVLFSDETSMVGIYKFLDMLKALPNGAKLILIGDPAQLESIEPGSILDDIVNSRKFAVTELIEVHRQARDSGIIDLATKARLGELFVSDTERQIQFFGTKKDAIFIPGRKEITTKNIMKSYKSLLVRGYKPDDISVILPMKKADAGTRELNKLLQEYNNPSNGNKKEILYEKFYSRIYREGDKVINIQNDYNVKHFDINLELIEGESGIINGDIGTIYKIFKERNDNYIAVLFDNFIVLYNENDLDHLEHAYACTFHKMQGSSSPAVILGLDGTHKIMAKRSLLYTGITRSSEILAICGEPSVINKAIKNNEILYKRTFLKDILLS